MSRLGCNEEQIDTLLANKAVVLQFIAAKEALVAAGLPADPLAALAPHIPVDELKNILYRLETPKHKK